MGDRNQKKAFSSRLIFATDDQSLGDGSYKRLRNRVVYINPTNPRRSATHPKKNQGFDFLRLPLELRIMVYTQHLALYPPRDVHIHWTGALKACRNPNGKTDVWYWHHECEPQGPLRQHGIFLVNKQISDEYKAVAHNSITYQHDWTYTQVLNSTSPHIPVIQQVAPSMLEVSMKTPRRYFTRVTNRWAEPVTLNPGNEVSMARQVALALAQMGSVMELKLNFYHEYPAEAASFRPLLVRDIETEVLSFQTTRLQSVTLVQRFDGLHGSRQQPEPETYVFVVRKQALVLAQSGG